MDLICFAHAYTAHQKDAIVTNIEFSMLYTTSQSLQLNEKLLMMQYIAVIYQNTVYMVHVG